ncbi:MAG: ammonium transporter [Dehalococcoidales bacterium]|jgi:Amt family ammonium transporter
MPINSADTAWVLVSAAMVMLMTPGVAFFYGGMVRRKNFLSTLMMCFVTLGLIGLLWVAYGYSLSFGPDKGGIIGGLNFVGLLGVGQTPSSVYATTIPQLAFAAFQMMFAVITVALITGAVVERIKFSSLLVFSALWFTLVYCPVTHWVWGGGWLQKMGFLDFAGGTVVHITAGVSALALAIILGPRKGYYEGERMDPSNIPMVLLGAGILWFGWFGFNAGSALTSGGLASSAFMTTYIAGAAGAVTWMILGWCYQRPSVLGVATGAVAGLATITPAAGFVQPVIGIPIGIAASLIGFYMMAFRAKKTRIDESLDVWAVHGMGGTFGTLAIGFFASLAVNPAGRNGLFYGHAGQVLIQLTGIAAVWAFAFGMTWVIGKLVDLTMGLRVSPTEERIGLDISQHGERAYGGPLR